MSPASFEACKAAFKLLKTKKKSANAMEEFPNINQVLELLESKLVSHSPAWRDINFTLTQSQRTHKRHMVKIWTHRTRTTGIRNISNFMYLQNQN